MKTVKRYSFTMVELLVVVGIIAVLAGLITPAVISAQTKGRITQARSDMHSLMMAIKGVEGAYNKMLGNSGSVSSPEVKFLNSDSYKAEIGTSKTGTGTSSVSYTYAVMGPAKDGSGKDIEFIDNSGISSEKVKLSSATEKAYDAYIVELSDPSNNAFGSTAKKLNVNKRRQRFLDPQSGYDPSQEFGTSEFDTANADKLWLDPWGNRYILIINVNHSDAIANPADPSKLVGTSVGVVSCGPNAIWDNGKNIDVNVGSPTKDQDDICSWNN